MKRRIELTYRIEGAFFEVVRIDIVGCPRLCDEIADNLRTLTCELSELPLLHDREMIVSARQKPEHK